MEQRQLGQQYEATLRERAEGVERDLRREVEMLTAPQLSSRLVTETQALAAETRMKTEVAAAHATAPLPDVLECPGDGPPPEPFTL